MPFPRATGILLHPTSLPARGGIGDLGPAAYEFLDFLAAARQGLWQVLPLGPLGYGNSPYSSISAFAGNPLLISLERLAERGWLDRGRLSVLPEQPGNIDFERVRAAKMPLLWEAANNFLETAPAWARERFQRFRHENGWWLEDAVLFGVLRRRFQQAAWNQWPGDLARRQPAALEQARRDLASDLEVGCAIQFAFFEQWRALHRACRRRGIRILGDIAIFVN